MYADFINYVRLKDIENYPVVGSVYFSSSSYSSITSSLFCDFRIIKYFQFFSPNVYLPQFYRSPSESQMIGSLEQYTHQLNYFGLGMNIGYEFFSRYKNFAMIKTFGFYFNIPSFKLGVLGLSNYFRAGAYYCRKGIFISQDLQVLKTLKFGFYTHLQDVFQRMYPYPFKWRKFKGALKFFIFELHRFTGPGSNYVRHKLFSPMFTSLEPTDFYFRFIWAYRIAYVRRKGRRRLIYLKAKVPFLSIFNGFSYLFRNSRNRFNLESLLLYGCRCIFSKVLLG